MPISLLPPALGTPVEGVTVEGIAVEVAVSLDESPVADDAGSTSRW